MAKQTRSRKAAVTAAAKVAQSNGIAPETIREYVERWDSLSEELASEKGSFMKKAQRIAEDKKELLKEAKTRGLDPKALRSEIKCRDLAGKIAAERGSLEGESAEQAELIRKAILLLETPLTPGGSDDDEDAETTVAKDNLDDDNDDD